VVFDRDIRQRDALFDLGSLAYVRQVQIILCRSDLAKAGNGETKKKRLKRDCFHIVAVTVPKFSILRYQIICGFHEYGLILADRRSMQKAAAIFALVMSSEVETSLEIADMRVIGRISWRFLDFARNDRNPRRQFLCFFRCDRNCPNAPGC
jgi:hypothetical protein